MYDVILFYSLFIKVENVEIFGTEFVDVRFL